MERDPHQPSNAPCPWGPYRHTTLHAAFDDGTRVAVDLSKPIEASLVARLVQTHGARFAILTAYNPRFLTEGACSAEANARHHARLADELTRRGLRFTEADGHANDAPEHVERGFLVACDLALAERLSCDFGQDAFFAFDGNAFWIHPAGIADRPSMRLP